MSPADADAIGAPEPATRQIDRENGRFRSVVTHLEMRARPSGLPPDPPRPDARLRRWREPDLDTYLALFHRVGDRWLWYGRLDAGREEIAALLQSPDHEVYRLWAGDEVAGLCELSRAVPGEVEVAYCGLVPEWIGGGLGGFLLRSALHEAWRKDVQRVWLHTCTEDHPGALEFYRHIGFRPFAQEVEWVHDPRLRGLLPRDAGPHVPLAE